METRRQITPNRSRAGLVRVALGIGFAILAGCGRSGVDDGGSAPATTLAPSIAYEPRPIGDGIEGRPWITHLIIVDLDGDGLGDVVACDARTNTIRWIQQHPVGVFTESQLGGEVRAPAHVEPCDIDRDGDLDLLVACMGQVLPNNDLIGSVVVLENTGPGAATFRNRVLLENVARVTDVRGGDLDDDGDVDLAVAQFGYAQGEVRWMRNDGDWRFTSRQLVGLSGAIHAPIGDLDGDGRPEITALISQEWEEVHVFRNHGGGDLRDTLVWGSTNEDFGSSGLMLTDLDRDGDPDIVFTNGDAFDYSRPGPRPWHGVQWLENRGGAFSFHRVGDFAGAYSPACVDLNGDGHKDLVAVSGFNNWDDPKAVTLMAWLNNGKAQFTPVVLARQPTHLIAVAAADMDGDGVPEIVTGGFHAYPPWDRMSRVTLWKRR
jgi:hypothetical protein